MMLDNLITKRNAMQQRFSETAPSPAEIWAFQELLYRIQVLETFKVFCQTAPCGTDVNIIMPHYKMVDAYIQHLSLERQFGKRVDEATQKQRQTALGSLQAIVGDYRRRFQSFRPTSAELYGNDIANIIKTVIPAWVVHRNCYVSLEIEEEESV